jgi:hypothetical protein
MIRHESDSVLMFSDGPRQVPSSRIRHTPCGESIPRCTSRNKLAKIIKPVTVNIHQGWFTASRQAKAPAWATNTNVIREYDLFILIIILLSDIYNNILELISGNFLTLNPTEKCLIGQFQERLENQLVLCIQREVLIVDKSLQEQVQLQ